MRVLFVVHGYPPAASAGTEVYVHDLAGAIASSRGDEAVVLTRDADQGRPELSVRTTREGAVTVVRINNNFQACANFEDSYANPAIRDIAGRVLDEHPPDVAHVHHLTCLSTGLLAEIGRRRIPLVMTLNDYWLICHRGQLLDRDGVRCDGPFDGGCGRCVPGGVLAGATSYRAGRLARELPIPGAARAVQLAVWAREALTSEAATRAATLHRLHHMQAAASHVDLFLAPSDTLAEKFRQFGLGPDRLVRCEQGIDLAPFAHVTRTPSSVLRIGFAGGLIPSKAPHLLLDAVAALPPGSVLVDLLGGSGAYHGESGYAEAIDRRMRTAPIRRLGPVPHERMAAALADVDVIVVPSVWIENAPFIIREAFAAGAPVVASDLGGMAEMVRHGTDGLLFAPGDAADLARQLRRLLEETGLLEHLRSGIRRPMSIEEDAAALRGVYRRFVTEPVPSAPRPPVSRGPAGHADVAAVVLNYRTPHQTWLAVRSLQTSFAPPSRIFVVDNGSGDGSAASLAGSLDGVSLIDTGANLGFAGGCNAGIRAALDAGAAFVLLVNSDAVLAPDAIDYLLAAAAADDTLGILAPVLLSREEPDHVSSAGIAFSRVTARMRHRAAGMRIASLSPPGLQRVDAVSGCVMLVRRGVFERAGLFDAEYFFSFEDIDLCLRAGAAGFGTACVHDAVAYHEGGRSIGRSSSRRVYFATRNHLRLAARAGDRSGRHLRSVVIVGLNAAYVMRAPEAPLVGGLAAVARGLWHHMTGRYGED